MRNEIATPGYWMNETTGRLQPVVERYLNNGTLSFEDCVVMRAYLRQWIFGPLFRGPEVDRLREDVETLFDDHSVRLWIYRATRAGCDPL